MRRGFYHRRGQYRGRVAKTKKRMDELARLYAEMMKMRRALGRVVDVGSAKALAM